MTIDTTALRKLLTDGGSCHLVSAQELRVLLDAYDAAEEPFGASEVHHGERA